MVIKITEDDDIRAVLNGIKTVLTQLEDAERSIKGVFNDTDGAEADVVSVNSTIQHVHAADVALTLLARRLISIAVPKSVEAL